MFLSSENYHALWSDRGATNTYEGSEIEKYVLKFSSRPLSGLVTFVSKLRIKTQSLCSKKNYFWHSEKPCLQKKIPIRYFLRWGVDSGVSKKVSWLFCPNDRPENHFVCFACFGQYDKNSAIAPWFCKMAKSWKWEKLMRWPPNIYRKFNKE